MPFKFIISLVLASLVCINSVWAEDRIALVIGNSAYPSAPLINPHNDATAMAALLTKAGFRVDRQLDTDLPQLQAAVDRFGKEISDPKVKFGLFYYAGHGLQQDWRNYLVPVSANIKAAAEVPRQTVDVSNLLRYMDKAQGRSFLVILDACRDDPFAGTFKPPAKGLSQFDAPVGSLLAYATAPGNVAQDGEGQNGLYTGFLLREFAIPGARLEDAFKRVRLSVRLASKGAQIPWESTSLEEDLYLFPLRSKAALSESERDLLLEKEMNAWLRVRGNPDPEVLAGFIREYPSGSASELAQSRLNRLLAAMAERESQRITLAAQASAKTVLEMADRDEAARRLAAQIESKRLAALRAEEDRIRVAQAEEAQLEARRQKAAEEAAALVALARKAAETTARAQAIQLSEKNAQAALAEVQRLQALQLEREAAERTLTLKAEQARIELAREARAQQEEIARIAAQKQALLVQAPLPPAPVVLLPTPFSKGYAEHQRKFTVGDQFNIRVVDMFNRSEKPLALKVTQVDNEADRVIYNNGEFVSDLMGNTTTNQRGSFSTPRQFYPADLFVGKKWQTRFKQSRQGGVTYTYQYDMKVVGVERVTVPAGTFDAFKIEARGFNMELGAALERNIWVAPGMAADVAHEIKVRLRDGRVEQNDRQELVSFSQALR